MGFIIKPTDEVLSFQTILKGSTYLTEGEIVLVIQSSRFPSVIELTTKKMSNERFPDVFF